MEKALRFTLLVFVILLAGVAFPKVFFDDAKNIPEETIVRARDSLASTFLIILSSLG